MILFFDIGGTKFRYYLLDDEYLIDSYTTLCSEKDIILLLKNCIMFLNTFYEIYGIYVSIATFKLFVFAPKVTEGAGLLSLVARRSKITLFIPML